MNWEPIDKKTMLKIFMASFIIMAILMLAGVLNE